MNTREKAHALFDELSSQDLDDFVQQLEQRHEPDAAQVAEARTAVTDDPFAPTWVAAVHQARR
jgi:hypothetical protein